MVQPIPDSVKELWSTWNVRGFILLSLGMQTVLVLFAPFRKRTANNFVIFAIWFAYLLADWVAGFAVGLVADSQSDDTTDTGLFTLWASFLLLHLGGPDTITALSLEDNELWMRLLLGLAAQTFGAGYLYLQSLPKNKLWVPTLLLFVAGIIKYIERTRALQLASNDKFRETILEGGQETINSYIELTRENFLSGRHALDMVRYAKRYIDNMKCLIVDILYGSDVRDASREFFYSRTAEDALQLIAVELNLIYEILFTKIVAVHGIIGYIFRSVSLILEVVALALFFFKIEKHGLDRFDVGVTYTLLLGAIILESVALVMLLFSDWTAAKLKSMKPVIIAILDAFLARNCLKWESCTSLSAEHKVLATPLLFRRWSESILRFDLVSYCLRKRPQIISKPRRFSGFIIEEVMRYPFDKITGFLRNSMRKCLDGLQIICCNTKGNSGLGRTDGKYIHCLPNKVLEIFNYLAELLDIAFDWIGLKELVDKWRYSSSEPLRKELWEFIFHELKEKSRHAILPAHAVGISSARGELVVQMWPFPNMDINENIASIRNTIRSYITSVDYNHSILVWHMATDLCYYTEDDIVDDTQSFSNKDCREVSKVVSDYMLYLLIMQPTLMSAVAGYAQIKFKVISKEITWLLRKDPKNKEMQMACECLLDTKPGVGQGPLVMHDARELAKTLKKMKDSKWQLMSRVWVEMLSYAACQCEASAHIEQLSTGGQLLTFVWLLMAHFGLVNPSLLTQQDGQLYWDPVI